MPRVTPSASNFTLLITPLHTHNTTGRYCFMPGLHSKKKLQTEVEQIEHTIPISNTAFCGR